MGTTSDTLTVLSSFVIRVSAYVFLQWIPTSVVPPALVASVLTYVPAFLMSFRDAFPYQETLEIIEEITIVDPTDRQNGAVDTDDIEVIDEMKDAVLIQRKDPQVFKTLLTGLPSPSSSLWGLVTFGINVALVGMALDRIYRAPVFHPANDLYFARVGYVSDTAASILIREPRSNQLPLYVRYRLAETLLPADSAGIATDVSWKFAKAIGDFSNETDFTSAVTIKRLTSDTRYQYVLSNNLTGHFTTAPRLGHVSRRDTGKFTFLHSSCILSQIPYNPFSHPLSIQGFKYLAKWIPKLGAHFMIFLGDFIYIDVPVRLGSDVATYRRNYRQVYASPDWPAVSNDLPWIHVLDDHEISNDWDANTTGVYAAAADPWQHYHVSVNPPPVRKGATYFHFDQGLASFFMLETRRFRDPEGVKNATDPTKSMLGSEQLEDLLRWLRRPLPSGVHWKIIISSVPFTRNWHFGIEDSWGGYMAERQKILEAMWDVGSRGVGVVVLSGDRHEFAATALQPPKDGKWPVSATVHEFSTSPLNMFYLPWRTYKETDGDVCIKYIPDGNSKFGAVELSALTGSDQGVLKYRLFIDGKESWSYSLTTPPIEYARGRAKDAIWG